MSSLLVALSQIVTERKGGNSGEVWLGECPSVPANDCQEDGSSILLSWWRKMWLKVGRRKRAKHSPGECPRVLFRKSSHRVLESSSNDAQGVVEGMEGRGDKS